MRGIPFISPIPLSFCIANVFPYIIPALLLPIDHNAAYFGSFDDLGCNNSTVSPRLLQRYGPAILERLFGCMNIYASHAYSTNHIFACPKPQAALNPTSWSLNDRVQRVEGAYYDLLVAMELPHLCPTCSPQEIKNRRAASPGGQTKIEGLCLNRTKLNVLVGKLKLVGMLKL